MKVLFLVLLCLFGGGNAPCAARPVKPEMKGMELYSWSEQGKWIFVLLPGTNRLKSESEVKSSPNRINGIAALQAGFMDLAEEELVVWNFHFVAGFAFPDQGTFDEVLAAAKSARITLAPDRNEKR